MKQQDPLPPSHDDVVYTAHQTASPVSTADTSAAKARASTLPNSPAQTHLQSERSAESPSTTSSEFAHTLLGPYRILERLGEGSMGSVFKAQHEHLGKLVALKVLPARFIRRSDLVARFKREMKAVGKLTHPRIVQAFDAGEIDGAQYLAMEFVAGTDLQKFVQDHGPLSAPHACELVRQAALALDAAHQSGLVHRDVKPANLLLEPSGQLKLLDLGLALLVDEPGGGTEVTVVGETFGTPDYMSPEQWDSAHNSDARTDLYALGCTLFYLLVGRAPYAAPEHASFVSKMKAHVTAPIPHLNSDRPDVPAGVAAIYEKLLAKEPSQRFQSGRELAAALAPFASALASTPARMVAAAMPPATQLATQRMRIALGLGSAVLAILVGTIIVRSIAKDGATLPSVASPITTPAGWHGWPADSPQPAVAPFTADQAKQYQEAWAAYLQVPADFTNTIGLKLKLIPPGEFLMGTTPEAIEEAIRRIEDPNDIVWPVFIRSEGPQHRVILTQAVYLGVYEVTQREYAAIMRDNPSDFAMFGSDEPLPRDSDDTRRGRPVDSINWQQATQFCLRLSAQEQLSPTYSTSGSEVLSGTGYRLPTEAEWEFACRAGTRSEFWIGNSDQELKQAAWFDGNARSETHTVGSLLANPFGLFDVHGNLYEWVQDEYDPTYYALFAATPAINPTGPSTGGPRRVLRGGYWNNVADHCRAANRLASGPRPALSHNHGFRVALSVDAVRQLQKNIPPREMPTAIPRGEPFASDHPRQTK